MRVIIRSTQSACYEKNAEASRDDDGVVGLDCGGGARSIDGAVQECSGLCGICNGVAGEGAPQARTANLHSRDLAHEHDPVPVEDEYCDHRFVDWRKGQR